MLSSGAQVLIVDSCKAHDDDDYDNDDDNNGDDDDDSCVTHGCDKICFEMFTLYQVKKVKTRHLLRQQLRYLIRK